MNVQDLDIPFNCRFTCWFCGEGSHKTIVSTFSTPACNYSVNMPICDECKSYRCHLDDNHLVRLKALIKEKIVKRSAKELAIGANWTEKELQESELHGNAFDGFKRSGWSMYLIAKERVNYNGWPLCIEGITIEDIATDEEIEFDGLTFTSVTSMLDYLSQSFALNREFLRKALTLYGTNRAIDAVKFCRLVPNYSKFEQNKAIKELIASIKEKEALALQQKQRDNA